jgi:formate dehydrogenase maturation protein FdhE
LRNSKSLAEGAHAADHFHFASQDSVLSSQPDHKDEFGSSRNINNPNLLFPMSRRQATADREIGKMAKSLNNALASHRTSPILGTIKRLSKQSRV